MRCMPWPCLKPLQSCAAYILRWIHESFMNLIFESPLSVLESILDLLGLKERGLGFVCLMCAQSWELLELRPKDWRVD